MRILDGYLFFSLAKLRRLNACVMRCHAAIAGLWPRSGRTQRGSVNLRLIKSSRASRVGLRNRQSGRSCRPQCEG